MDDGRIRSALKDATDTRDVVIGPGALAAVAEVVARGAGDRPAVVVADETTWRVAGERVQRRLEAAGRATAEPYRFPPGSFVYAEYGNVERLRDALAATTPSRWPSARGRSTTSSSGPPTSSAGRT